MLRAFVVAATILLSACATNLAENLKPVSSDNYIVLKDQSTYIVTRGMGVKWTEGLNAGIYKPELENNFGTFFRGPPSCVQIYMGTAALGPYEGGVWIPKDRINRHPLIYYYANLNVSKAAGTMGVLAAPLLLTNGSLTFVATPATGTFVDGLVVTNLPLK